MKQFPLSAAFAAALGLLLAAPAGAQQSTTVQVGLSNIQPNSSATPISGPFTPANATTVEVQGQTTAFFSLAHNFDANWSVELALGVPPIHDVTLKVINPSALPPSVAAMNGTVVAHVTQFAPTLFANYTFGKAQDKFRPYLGLGVNYTEFDSPQSTPANNTINGGPTTISLTSSTGAAFQIGGVYHLSGPWSLNANWSTAQVQTTETTNTLGVQRSSTITFNPSVVTLALAFTF